MDENHDAFLELCGLCQPETAPTEADIVTCADDGWLHRSQRRAPQRHAYGPHRLPYRTPVGLLSLNILPETPASEDYELENPLAKHIVIRRGKKPRVTSEPTPVVLKKKAYNLEPTVIASALAPCCTKKCNERFSYTDVATIRHEFWNLTRPRQLDWVTRQLAFYGTASATTGVFSFKYVLLWKETCAKFWEQALPISHGRLSLARSKVLTLQMEDSQSADSPSNCPKSDSAEAYIRDYARENGGAMPDCEDVQLPAGKTKEAVFCDYLIDMFHTDEEVEKNAASLSTWYKTWRSRCFHVKAPKWQKFSKCSTCSNIKVLREFTDASKQGEWCDKLIPR